MEEEGIRAGIGQPGRWRREAGLFVTGQRGGVERGVQRGQRTAKEIPASPNRLALIGGGLADGFQPRPEFEQDQSDGMQSPAVQQRVGLPDRFRKALDSTARTGVAVGGAGDPDGYAAPVLIQQFPGAGGVQAGNAGVRVFQAGSLAGAEQGRMVVPHADSRVAWPVVTGDRALRAGRNAQAAAVADAGIEAQALVINDPGAARAGIGASTATGMADARMNTAVGIHLGEAALGGEGLGLLYKDKI